MSDEQLPNLKFSQINFGEKQIPWDLARLLYKGGAGTKVNVVDARIASGELGAPLLERLPLVEKLHEEITGKLAAGLSPHSADTTIAFLRLFFSWVDIEKKFLNLETVENLYVAWADHLLQSSRIGGGSKASTVYKRASTVALILNSILNLKVGLIFKTRIRSAGSRRQLNTQTDKSNLEAAFAFGHALLDMSDSLSAEAIFGPLPVSIQFRTGTIIQEWSELKPPEKLKALTEKNISPSVLKRALEKRSAWIDDASLRTRWPMIKLRIQAEVLIFLSQTGMNLMQAEKLEMGSFRYESYIDGYKVYRLYKGRRQGEVEFEIFSEYKVIFERYLSWRTAVFSNELNTRLFPKLGSDGEFSVDLALSSMTFNLLKNRCTTLGLRFIPPRELRKVRVNWLLRRSRDPEMTAEMHAHTQATLLRNYEQPSLQVAAIEISRFHSSTALTLVPPGPGACIEAVPELRLDAPPNSPTPDCNNPAGCLFCFHQRDIDNEDHVWSLASYRHLKSLELTSFRQPSKKRDSIPVVNAIKKLTEKIQYFHDSNQFRAMWVREALARIEEGSYHPRWDGFIQLLEAPP